MNSSPQSGRGRARWARLLQRVSLRERIFGQRPLATAYRPRLSEPGLPPHVWRLFHRQADALAFARGAAVAQELHTFAFERPNQVATGTRTFLVTSYPEFWHHYQVHCTGRASHQAHYYEVIAEGSMCHLYFDVEFSRESNPDLDGSHLTAILIKYVCACIQACYGLACTMGDVLSLDSSSASKFSQHLLFHIPGAAFQNNLQAGNFVRKVFEPLAEKIHNMELQGVQAAVPDPAETTSSLEFQESFEIRESSDVLESYEALWDDADCKEAWTENWEHEFGIKSSGIKSSFSVSQNYQQPNDNGECTETLHDHTNAKCSHTGEITLDCSATWYPPQDERTARPNKRSLWEILDYRATWQDLLEILIVKDKHGQFTLAVDLGVYTKNRNFRLYGSSKAGVLVPLLLASTDSFVAQRLPAWGISKDREMLQASETTGASVGSAGSLEANKQGKLQERIFLASLITNVEIMWRHKKIVLLRERESSYAMSAGFDNYVRMCSIHHSFKATSANEHCFVFKGALDCVVQGPGLRLLSCLGSHTGTRKTNIFTANNSHGDSRVMTGYQASPFPEIDTYIRSQLNKGGIQGDLRCWSFCEHTGLLVYEIRKNRWCENVGRAHRSNHTRYVVDLRQEIFYQTCHDPECKAINFRSQNYPLPQECLPGFILSLSDGDDNFPGHVGDKD